MLTSNLTISMCILFFGHKKTYDNVFNEQLKDGISSILSKIPRLNIFELMKVMTKQEKTDKLLLFEL